MKFFRDLTVDVTYFAQSIILTCSKREEKKRKVEFIDSCMTNSCIRFRDYATYMYIMRKREKEGREREREKE